MSLSLCIYSRKGKLSKEDFLNVIDEFSLEGKRKLHNNTSEQMISMSTDPENIFISKGSIIIFSGDIYNYYNERNILINKGYEINNHAEFMLHAYREFGESFLKQLNGTFSSMIFDMNKDKMTVINDSFGVYPLFVYITDDVCMFCSEFEPIVKYKGFDKSLNNDAIAQYFVFGLPLGDRTFFRDIKNLSPGTIMTIFRDKIKKKKYDELDIKIEKNKDIDYFAEKISKVFRQAVQCRVKDRENLLCELSGGADTRLLLSTLTKKQRKNIEFITYNTLPIKEVQDKDVVIAKMIAGELGLRHRIIKKRKRFEITDLARKGREYPREPVLTGFCGGEFLGGDCFDFSTIKISEMNKKDMEQKLQVFNKAFTDNISDPNQSLSNEIKGIKAENKALLFYLNQFTRGFFTDIYRGYGSGFLTPCTNILRWDSPFWDKDFLKALLAVPKEYLLDYKLYNRIYSTYFPELIDIPTNSPITLRSDSCMDYLNEGIDRKSLKRRFSKGHDNVQKYQINDFYNMKFILKNHRNIRYLKQRILVESLFFNKMNHMDYKYRKPFKFAFKKASKHGMAKRIFQKFHENDELGQISDKIINSFVHFETWSDKFL